MGRGRWRPPGSPLHSDGGHRVLINPWVRIWGRLVGDFVVFFGRFGVSPLVLEVLCEFRGEITDLALFDPFLQLRRSDRRFLGDRSCSLTDLEEILVEFLGCSWPVLGVFGFLLLLIQV